MKEHVIRPNFVPKIKRKERVLFFHDAKTVHLHILPALVHLSTMT